MPTKSTVKKKKKNPIGVAFGKLGAAKGGKARAEKLSPGRRSEIARNAALARARKLSPSKRSAIAKIASNSRG